MAKKSADPWDDSVLLEAFERGISNYKVMHGIGSGSNSDIVEDLVDAEAITCSSAEAAGDNQNIEDTCGEQSSSHHGGITHDEYQHFQGKQLDQQSCHGHQMHEPNICAVSEDYNLAEYQQLFHQYYELEQQRMKILEQLYQSYLNSQSCIQFVNNPANQEFSALFGHSGRHSSHVQASKGGQQMPSDYSKLNPKSDNNVTVSEETVTEAERAISSLNLDSSPGPFPCAGRVEVQDTNAWSSDTHNGSSDVDLSVVLGAWYSAGFYTGRYLSQQSHKRSGD